MTIGNSPGLDSIFKMENGHNDSLASTLVIEPQKCSDCSSNSKMETDNAQRLTFTSGIDPEANGDSSFTPMITQVKGQDLALTPDAEAGKTLDLTSTIGGCGSFQTILAFIVSMATFLASMSIMFMAFGVYNPGWKCATYSSSNSSFTMTSMPNDSLPIVSTPSHGFTEPPNDHSHCSTNNSNKTSSPKTNECIVLENNSCPGGIQFNSGASTVVTEWNLICGKAWLPSMMISVQMAAILIGAYSNGQIGDVFGRKISILTGVGLLALGHLSAALSMSWQWYTFSIAAVGLGIGATLTCSFYYPLEFVPQLWRGMLTSVPIWSLGCTTYAVGVYIIRDWRYLHVTATIIGALIFLAIMIWIPESIRWLAVNGKTEKAKKIVQRIAHSNNRNPPDMDVIDTVAVQERLKMGEQHRYTYLDLFKIKSIRGYSLKFGFIWVVLSASYYTISFNIKSLSGDFFLNFILFAALELPGQMSIAPIINKFGRRISTLIYMAIIIICSTTLAVKSFLKGDGEEEEEEDAGGIIIVVCALVCKVTIIGGWMIITLYSAELYPTVVRSLHYGYLNSVARLGAIAAPYLMPDKSEHMGIPFLVVSILHVAIFLIVWCLPETKDTVLSDSA